MNFVYGARKVRIGVFGLGTMPLWLRYSSIAMTSLTLPEKNHSVWVWVQNALLLEPILFALGSPLCWEGRVPTAAAFDGR